MQFVNAKFMVSQLSQRAVGWFCTAQLRKFHISPTSFGLMEFFDDPKNWGEAEVKAGRPWRRDELRLKSNTDIHKLWYVLLKERNMLLTMEEEYKRKMELFPNPERIWKVEESMRNIMDIVAERNRAYNLLETGTTGKPRKELVQNEVGLLKWRRQKEWHVPEAINNSFSKTPWYAPLHKEISAMHRLIHEKELAKTRRMKRQIAARAALLKRKFPHVQWEECRRTAEKQITERYRPVWEVDPPY